MRLPSHRSVRAAFIALLSVAVSVSQAAPALGAQLPQPGSSLFLQTSGPGAGINIGDYYTSPAGGNTDHLFELRVPSNWPSGVPVTVALYDPELAGPNPSSPPASDEVRGSADSAVFTLVAPGGGTLATDTYADSSTNGAWVELATFDPGISGTGIYEIHVTVSDNDDNSWRVDASHDPDCAVGGPDTCDPSLLQNGNESGTAPGGSGPLGLGVVRTSYQHSGSGLVCQDHVFYVNSSTPRPLRAHNFDMDNNGSVTYTTPGGATVPGTVSANGKWNNSSDTNRVGDILPDTNGWWTAEVCISTNNQYVFEAPSAGPSFPEPQPTPRLTLEVDDGVDTVQVGDQMTYLITVSNVSDTDPLPGDAHQVSTVASLPTGVSFVGCTAPSGVTCVESSGEVAITQDSTLAPGSSLVVELTVEAGPGADDPVVQGAVLDYEDHLGNSQPTETADDSDDVEFNPALAIGIAGPSQILRGDTAGFTYSVSHSGSSDGSDVGSAALNCDTCTTFSYLDGDTDLDGAIDLSETWTYEATLDTGAGDPDPISISLTASGTDRDGDPVETTGGHELDLIEPGSIAGTVFEDLDGDGVLDPGEPHLDGAEITLLRGGSGLTSQTPVDGTYDFTHLHPDSYDVEADSSGLPPGMAPTASEFHTVDLAEGQAAAGLDFGYAHPVTVSGSVFADDDFDAVVDAGEPGVAGTIIELVDGSDTVVATATSGTDGSYEFTTVPGSYMVRVADGIPFGWTLTTPDSIDIGLVQSGASSTGHDFGVGNRAPLSDDQEETIELEAAPDSLSATDPEGTDVSFEMVSGTLAAGLTLNPDGTFDGQAWETGVFDMMVEVCDSGQPSSCSQSQYTLTVEQVEVAGLEVLPFTGIESGALALIAMSLMGGGAGLLVLLKREETTV